jgi:hypothetical protein
LPLPLPLPHSAEPGIHAQTLRARIREVLGIHAAELDVVLAQAELLCPGCYVRVRGDPAALDETILSLVEAF